MNIPEINSSHLKMDGWKISFLFGVASSQERTVRFRECNVQIGHWHMCQGLRSYINIEDGHPTFKRESLILGIQTPTLIGLMRWPSPTKEKKLASLDPYQNHSPQLRINKIPIAKRNSRLGENLFMICGLPGVLTNHKNPWKGIGASCASFAIFWWML